MAEDQQATPTTSADTTQDPRASASVALLRERFGDGVLDVVEYRGETTVLLRPEIITEACRTLRDAPDLRYDYLADVTAVDWPERLPRFDVVYHLLSLQTRAVLRLKVGVGDDDTPEPEVPTVTTVWPSANWFEREVFDLFGIRFAGHPNLTRILMPVDWVGHPLRKDYPLTGFSLPEPHWGGQVPFKAPLPQGTGEQTLRTLDGFEIPATPDVTEREEH